MYCIHDNHTESKTLWSIAPHDAFSTFVIAYMAYMTFPFLQSTKKLLWQAANNWMQKIKESLNMEGKWIHFQHP